METAAPGRLPRTIHHNARLCSASVTGCNTPAHNFAPILVDHASSLSQLARSVTQPRAHIKGSSEDPTQNPAGCHFRECGRSQPLQACAKGASPQLKWHPQEREHSDGKAGTRDRVQRRDRLTAAPADGAVIAIAEGEPFRECPRRGVPKSLREGSKPQGRAAARLGS